VKEAVLFERSPLGKASDKTQTLLFTHNALLFTQYAKEAIT